MGERCHPHGRGLARASYPSSELTAAPPQALPPESGRSIRLERFWSAPATWNANGGVSVHHEFAPNIDLTAEDNS